LNLEQTEEISKLCKDIIFESGVECVTVINKRGRVIESESKMNDLFKNLTSSELEMLYMQRTLQTSMIKELNCRHGMWKYTITERQFGIEIIMPISDGILYVMVEPTADVSYFLQRFKIILANYHSENRMIILH
jgi:hypothetical protein